VNLWTCREDIVSSIRSRCTNTMCMHRLLMSPLKGFKGSCCLRKVLSASDSRTFTVCERYLDKQAECYAHPRFFRDWIDGSDVYSYAVQSRTVDFIHLSIY
jgi:hypothetical protein